MGITGITPETDEPRRLMCRGVRGAVVAEADTREAILAATRELVYIMIRANDIRQEDVASAIFTTTADLTATYPALAARQLGWYDVALMCGHEMAVPGGLDRCVRVLILWNTDKRQDEILHIYLREAQSLRPDRTEIPPIPWEDIEAAINGTITQVEAAR